MMSEKTLNRGAAKLASVLRERGWTPRKLARLLDCDHSSVITPKTATTAHMIAVVLPRPSSASAVACWVSSGERRLSTRATPTHGMVRRGPRAACIRGAVRGVTRSLQNLHAYGI